MNSKEYWICLYNNTGQMNFSDSDLVPLECIDVDALSDRIIARKIARYKQLHETNLIQLRRITCFVTSAVPDIIDRKSKLAV